MNNEQLYAALITQLKTVTSLFPLQTENLVSVSKTNASFSRASFIHTVPSTLTVGRNGVDLHQGIMQVDLFVPLNTGTTAVNAVADAVIAAFARGTTLTAGANKVHVTKAYRETAGRLNEQFHQVPVSIEWRVVA